MEPLSGLLTLGAGLLELLFGAGLLSLRTCGALPPGCPPLPLPGPPGPPGRAVTAVAVKAMVMAVRVMMALVVSFISIPLS